MCAGVLRVRRCLHVRARPARAGEHHGKLLVDVAGAFEGGEKDAYAAGHAPGLLDVENLEPLIARVQNPAAQRRTRHAPRAGTLPGGPGVCGSFHVAGT